MSVCEMPRLMNVPSPPAPMYAAIAVMPMLITTAMRTPAMITGTAIGISTCAQALRRRHAHADRGRAQRGIDVADRRVGVADDRQLRIEHRGDDRGQIADALADHRQQRNHHAEQRDRRNRHDDRAEVQHHVRGALVLRDRDPDRNAGEDREPTATLDDRDVLDRPLADGRQVVQDERQRFHRAPYVHGRGVRARRQNSRPRPGRMVWMRRPLVQPRTWRLSTACAAGRARSSMSQRTTICVGLRLVTPAATVR